MCAFFCILNVLIFFCVHLINQIMTFCLVIKRLFPSSFPLSFCLRCSWKWKVNHSLATHSSCKTLSLIITFLMFWKVACNIKCYEQFIFLWLEVEIALILDWYNYLSGYCIPLVQNASMSLGFQKPFNFFFSNSV